MSVGDRDTAAVHALGGLAPDDGAALEDDLGKNTVLASEVEEYRAVVETLESGIARETPPAGLFDVVLNRIDAERTVEQPAPMPSNAPELAVPTRRFGLGSGRVRRFAAPFAAGVAVAAAVVAIAVAASSGRDLGTPDARASVRGTPEFSAVHGDARLYATNKQDGVLVLDLDDVPAPAAGKHYEVWVLRQSGGGAMEAVGAFTPESARVRLQLGLPGPGDYEAVDVSVEPDGGPASHSGSSLAGGRFQPTQ